LQRRHAADRARAGGGTDDLLSLGTADFREDLLAYGGAGGARLAGGARAVSPGGEARRQGPRDAQQGPAGAGGAGAHVREGRSAALQQGSGGVWREAP